MMTLLLFFLKSADHLLLFTQNVRTVSVSHLAAYDELENMKELYCVTKNVEKVIRFREVDDQKLCIPANGKQFAEDGKC